MTDTNNVELVQEANILLDNLEAQIDILANAFPSIYENSEIISTQKYNDNLILRKESVCQKVYGIDERLEMDIIYNLKGKYVCCLEDLENNFTFIKDLSNVTHGLGFNEKEQKWYGWSHRAFFSFGIGSHVKKGDCAYVPDNTLNLIDDECVFWDINGKQLTYGDWAYTKTLKNVESIDKQIIIHYIEEKFDKNNVLIETKDESRVINIPESFGRGEWTALTLDDAKQMAQDFSKGVS